MKARYDGQPVQDLRGWEVVADRKAWGRGLAAHLVEACETLDISLEEALEELNEILVGVSLEPVLEGLGADRGRSRSGDVSRIDELLSREYRKARGAFMTPPQAARALVLLVDDLEEGPIIDPACGHGELLLASQDRWPNRRILGVELHAGLAIAAAIRLWRRWRANTCGGGEVKILVGDGLARLPAQMGGEGIYSLVIGNPPFLGEKGQAAFFRELRGKYPRFEPIFYARMDLLYLFLARGVELAGPGGQQAWLTPPYWLSADGARGLRTYLGEHVEAHTFVELREPGLFAASPGDELALTVLRRAQEGAETMGGVGRWFQGGLRELEESERGRWSILDRQLLKPSGWRPFTPTSVTLWRQRLERGGTRLALLASDHQGFVSGADRVTRRHLSMVSGADLELGEPIFLAETAEIPAQWEEMRRWVRPVLRSRELQPNQVFWSPPGSAWALYVDEAVSSTDDEALLMEGLGRFRPILERRREVERGLMPWYRLHWPRDRRAMEGPKLVVPRRSAAPCFSLDLSGSMVSSDITFLVAPKDVADPVRYLATLMFLLNSAETGRFLRYFGKRKGTQLEFYSTPLRQIIVSTRLAGGRLLLDEEIYDEAQRRDFSRRLDRLLMAEADGAG